MIDLTVQVKSEDTKLSEQFLIHEEGISLSPEDPILKEMVKSTLAKFSQKPIDPEIILKIKYVWDNVMGNRNEIQS